MKKLNFFLTMAVAMFLVAGAVPANAQGKYGKDSAQCVNYLNFYRDFLKQFRATKSAGNLNEAANQWRGAFKTCPPKASQNMFIDGRTIFQNLIRNEKNAQVREGLIDTLMLIHQTRQANYPKYKAAVAENIAFDMLSYYGNTNPEKVVAAIKDVVAISGNKTKADDKNCL